VVDAELAKALLGCFALRQERGRPGALIRIKDGQPIDRVNQVGSILGCS
jgi:hypothetical protein